MNKKKILSFISAGILPVILSACVSGGPAVIDEGAKDNSGKINIVATIFPEYDWVREIAGEDNPNVDITLLLDNGADLHSYQPTADDIIKISACDMFIYAGGESDEWVEDALSEATNKDMVVINLLDTLGNSIKEEESIEGMEADEHEHEDGDDHEESDREHKDDEVEYDEHVWLSLKNAETICRVIADKLGEIDSNNKDKYLENSDLYIKKLNNLDKEYEKAVSESTVRTLLFGDRFPFRYLVDDYGLSYYAAFVGCSAETEASFETIVFLANKVDELNLKTILKTESSDGKISETIKENTSSKDQKILTLDSMQSTSYSDIEKGTTYLSVMEKNLDLIKEALIQE